MEVHSLATIFSCLIISVLFIWLMKVLDDMRTVNFDEDQLIKEGNNAVAVRRAGMMLGFLIGMVGLLSSPSSGLWIDVILTLVYGGVLLVLLLVAFVVNDKFVLGNINNDLAVHEGNTAVSVVEFGSYVAAGLIANGVFSGEGNGNGLGALLNGMFVSLVFFGLGQVVLLVYILIYEKVTPFEIVDEVRKGNKAAALAIGGRLIALGVILRASLIGPVKGWTTDIMMFLLAALIGYIFLLIAREVVCRILLPHTKLVDEIEKGNTAATVMSEVTIFGLALIAATVI